MNMAPLKERTARRLAGAACLLAAGCATPLQAPTATPTGQGAPHDARALATMAGDHPAAHHPTLLTLDAAALATTRARLQRADASLQPAYAALLHRAGRAMTTPPRSVTHKTRTPPSGSRHDYMSMGPYWWPNPNMANGLPYVQRDGQRNPELADDALDSLRLQHMLADARDLALAYHFGGDPRHARQAAVVLRTWFLDPATRMNPNLNFAQGIPGMVQGRGIGLIDTRDLWWVIDAVALIAPEGSFNTTEQAALRRWFADYAAWFHTSALGRDEAAAQNNHGQFYDVQLAAYWLYTGQTALARQLVFDAQQQRLAAQIDPQGRMPRELARTRPFHYHSFTLEAATRLARYGQVLNALPAPPPRWPATDPRCAPPALQPACPLDLWRVNIDGRSLRGVLDFVAGAVLQPEGWRHATALEPEPPLATALPVLLMAQFAVPSPQQAAAIERLRPLAPDHVAWLLWPLR